MQRHSERGVMGLALALGISAFGCGGDLIADGGVVDAPVEGSDGGALDAANDDGGTGDGGTGDGGTGDVGSDGGGGAGPLVYVLSVGGNTLGQVELSATGHDTTLGPLSFVDELGAAISPPVVLGGIARSGTRLLGFAPYALFEIDPSSLRATRLHMATGGWPDSNALGADETTVYGTDQFSPFFVIPLADPTALRQVLTLAFRFEDSMGQCISHGDIVSLDANSVYFASVCDSPTLDASSSLVRFAWDGTDNGMVAEIVANLGMLNIDEDPALERAGAITGLSRVDGALFGMTDRNLLLSVRPDADGGITFMRALEISVLDSE